MHRTFRELVKETCKIYTITSWVRGEVQSTLRAPRYVIWLKFLFMVNYFVILLSTF